MRVVGVQFERGFPGLVCRRKIARQHLRQPEIVLSIRLGGSVSGGQGKGLLELREGFLVTTLPAENQAKTIIQRRILRLQRQRALNLAQRGHGPLGIRFQSGLGKKMREVGIGSTMFGLTRTA